MGEPDPADAAVVVVADAGPLIHLHEIRRLSLLRVFARVLIPDAVWGEAVERGSVPAAELLAEADVERRSVEPSQLARVTNLPAAKQLHVGELECLALCRELDIPLLLTDEAAREAATGLHIRPVGSIGVIVRATFARRITAAEARENLRQLYGGSSLFVAEALIDLAIKQVDRLS